MDETFGEASRAGPLPPASESAGPRLRHRRLWLIVAVILLAVGAGSSIYAFSATRASAEGSHKAFASTSVQISSTLQVAIEHEQDLVLSTESFIIGVPHPSQAQFTDWATHLNVLQLYKELVGLVVIQYVPASGLDAYAHEVSGNQTTPFQVTPSGARPYTVLCQRRYCVVPRGRFPPTTTSARGNWVKLSWRPVTPERAPSCPSKPARQIHSRSSRPYIDVAPCLRLLPHEQTHSSS
jgi:hypothetical protein